MPELVVIGGGLAGTEAAWQAAKRGVGVILFEMRPDVMTPAHAGGGLAELVCSNSLRASSTTNAVGLLKEEMRRLGSLVMRAADACSVPAGAALAVDRTLFSAYIERELDKHPLVNIVRREAQTLPPELTVVASGPLTSPALAREISALCGGALFFHDAIAPIVAGDSVDMNAAFWASRYDKGEGADYLNCPMNCEQYEVFYEALRAAELHPLRDFEEEKNFEGCLPLEVLAGRGRDTLRFGPLKPVGLMLPDGSAPHAVAQLRREDAQGSMFNLVGFQTRLKRAEQERVFRLIPGLTQAEFLRYGAMHRNTYIDSSRLLRPDLRFKGRDSLLFAGQLTGVEGYVESAACGLAAGINGARLARNEEPLVFPAQTALGALLRYITTPNRDFQPMNVTFGLLPPLAQRVLHKKEKNALLAERALGFLMNFMQDNELL
ncbi:MAG: methylenetetrahydrofolate--tRNA-(uracil(54)-C(5))-methyltransferase (FADH(2)-oxidizing) TrmFO [Clostridiales bacterium]|nr:methylenetetrahydrofolate--tRNA-(uracil(54)-C(5))-methyltransferase (FADH(2)-oxidizing) TrmFO [Clostridiales bacterium]